MTSSKKIKFDSQESGKSSEDMGYLQDIDFTKKSRWTDLHLKVEDKELYVPKSHLALVSPVFRLMFESYFKEKYLDVLPLPGKKYGDVLTFLKCTHPGSLVKVTYYIVPKVLPLAHEYQIKWLIDDCITAMMKEMNDSEFDTNRTVTTFGPNVSWICGKVSVGYPVQKSDYYKNCCDICIMAEKYGLSCVVERFIQIFSSTNYKCYKNLAEFEKISIDVRYRIVSGRLDSKEDRIDNIDLKKAVPKSVSFI